MNLTKKTITNMSNIRKICSSILTKAITTIEKTVATDEKNNAKKLRDDKKCNDNIRKICSSMLVKTITTVEKNIITEAKNNAKMLRDYKKYNDNIIKIYSKCLKDIKKRCNNEDDKTRKRCEDPCTELLCGLALCNANISIQNIVNMTYEDIQQFPALKVYINDFNGYIEDLKERLDNNEHDSLQQYILLWVEEYSKVVQFGKIKSIYMVGKINKFKELDTLNAQVKDKKDAKGDIMIELDDDKFIGLSVKAGNNATKSNYSIIKYFKDDVVKECQTIRAQYLTENGFPVFNKEDRPEVNKLFYDRFNPLFQKFREEVSKEDIGRQLVDSLYGVNLPYDIYEFNGKELVLLTNRNIDYNLVSFSECPEYYLKNNGIDRNAAKMFFKLQTGDVTYRVELRWKGVIHTAWPQFQIHSI